MGDEMGPDGACVASTNVLLHGAVARSAISIVAPPSPTTGSAAVPTRSSGGSGRAICRWRSQSDADHAPGQRHGAAVQAAPRTARGSRGNAHYHYTHFRFFSARDTYVALFLAEVSTLKTYRPAVGSRKDPYHDFAAKVETFLSRLTPTEIDRTTNVEELISDS
jgi:hypothetical protein